MIRLIEAQAGSLRRVLPAGRELGAWHAALVAEISAHLSPLHAALLARPEAVAGGMVWVAEGQSRVRYAELPQEGRRALDAAMGAILSDIRRLAESGVAPAVREAWPALREVPDAGHVFAVDGRRVGAAWGLVGQGVGAQVGSGRLSRLDDGVAWRAAPRPAWARYGMALGVLALLALATGLLLPLAYGVFVPMVAQCTIVPGQLEALRGGAALQDRGAALQTLLASLTEEVGRRQLLCPLPTVASPTVPVPVPVPVPAQVPPPPPPAPRADLPQERWDRGDLTMLEGCWNLTSDITVSSADGLHSTKVRTWQMCFDGHGSGQQTMALEDGRRCAGALLAAFDRGDVLRVTEPQNCNGAELHMNRSQRLCRRSSDTEAVCQGTTTEGGAAGHGYSGRFRR